MNGGPWAMRVYGDPAPKGSMKCVGAGGKIRHRLVPDDSGHGQKRWREAVTAVATDLAATMGAPIDEAAIVGIQFLLPRPAAAKTRTLPFLRANKAAPGGDVDKLTRMVLDALTDARVLADDSRVCLTLAGKAYVDDGHRPGAIVWVGPVGSDPHRVLARMLQVAPALDAAPQQVLD